ncbi:hypothetical protein BDZ89DRAFT_1127493 [Hymenopellis radicata]|nr:hypothetical protein BDZ89DRAFT_1127493 [Hymenopellis radicata]
MLSSPEETRLVDGILQSEGSDTLSADAAVEAFQPADLPPDVLARAVRLIGWAQRGFSVQQDLIEQQGPLADFHNAKTPVDSGSAFLILPSLSALNRAKYVSIFERAGPEKDRLQGLKAWKLMMMSKLPLKTLSRIWDLVDTQRLGYFSLVDFSIAMYLIHGTLEGHFTSLPPSIPPYLYEQAAGHSTSDDASSSKLPEPEPDVLSNAFTTDFYFIRASANLDSWTLPPIVKKHADMYFNVLDSQARGYIEGDQAVPFMLQSSLPFEELAQIWDLIDSTLKGHLNRDDFALALFLIYKTLAGISIPRPLPWNTRTSVVTRSDSAASEIHKPVLKRRASQLPSPQERQQLELSQELDLLRSQFESMQQLRMKERSTLQSQLHELQMSQQELVTENSELRLSLRNASHSIRRSMSMHSDKSNSLAVDNANLRTKLRQAEDMQTRLKNNHEINRLELTQENTLLQVKMESLITHLEERNTDYDVQKLVMDEITEELERLRAQVRELRESADLVPLTGGDEDLQRHINESLAKDNRDLRTQVEQLAESLEALQRTNAGMVPRETLEEAERASRRLNRRVGEVESEGAELQRRVRELEEENRRLRERERQRRRTMSQAAAPVDDVPPPYEVVGS